MLYYDPGYLTQKGGATGPPQWVYFTYVIHAYSYPPAKTSLRVIVPPRAVETSLPYYMLMFDFELTGDL